MSSSSVVYSDQEGLAASLNVNSGCPLTGQAILAEDDRNDVLRFCCKHNLAQCRSEIGPQVGGDVEYSYVSCWQENVRRLAGCVEVEGGQAALDPPGRTEPPTFSDRFIPSKTKLVLAK